MSSTTENLDSLVEHRTFLLRELAENAQAYLASWQQLKMLSPDSEEHSDLLGYALAQARQLGMDVEDVAETEEKILEFPDDEA